MQVTEKLVDAKEAFNKGFTINGSEAVLFEIEGVVCACLGVEDDTRGFRCDTIDGDAYAYTMESDEQQIVAPEATMLAHEVRASMKVIAGICGLRGISWVQINMRQVLFTAGFNHV